MPNLRIIFDDKVGSATVTATNTSGSLVASNMKTDIKSEVHRSTSRTVSYTVSWASDQSIGGVALPATNLSGDATIRVRLYNSGGSVVADSGTIFAAPGLNLGLWNWSQPINANTFAYGGVAKTAVWFNSHFTVRSLVIDLVDTTANTAGYIDCSRIVAGAYWQPSVNADYGVQTSIVDSSNNQRTNAGDLVTNRSFMYDSLAFDISSLKEVDRANLMLLLRKSGTARNIFVSLLPNNASSIAEQDFMIYGKRNNSNITYNFEERFANTFQIEGW